MIYEKRLEEIIEEVKKSNTFETLAARNWYLYGLIEGLKAGKIIDDENFKDSETCEYWEEQNRIAYRIGENNVFKIIKEKTNT